MMSDETMIERVARAMFEAGWPSEESRALAVKNNPNVVGGYRKLARAAIEAMREPSKGMIADGLYAIQSHMDSTTDSIASYDIAVDGTAYHGWVAMIDAALSEGTA